MEISRQAKGSLRVAMPAKILLTITSLIWLFYLRSTLGAVDSTEDLFSSPDAQSYLTASRWFGGDGPFSSIRPYLYPFLIWVLTGMGGGELLVAVQIIFWITALHFSATAIAALCGGSRTAYILGFCFLLLNVSLSLAPFHALTETAVFLGLSLWLFSCATLGKAEALIRGVAVFAFLTLLKPVFAVHFVVLFLLSCLHCFWGQIKLPVHRCILFVCYSALYQSTFCCRAGTDGRGSPVE